MKIGIPTEIKTAEKRVAVIPTYAKELVNEGHEVFVQKGAGFGSGFSDEEYKESGCKIVKNAEELYAKAQLIVKVKEPLDGDLQYLKKHHTLFCYLHLAAEPKLVEKLKKIGLTAIAYETVVVNNKTPLLAPMSAIAGRLAIQLGSTFLHSYNGGRGTLLGGIWDKKIGNVTVVGAGVAGTESIALAHGMGANVTVLDINGERLQQLAKTYKGIEAVVSTPQALEEILPITDILIGGVYVIGKKAPVVVSKKHVELMPKGSVIIDISIDQGGCVETSKPCTHQNQHYVESGVIHSAITNLPAAAPRTASEVLNEATNSYIKKLANNNIDDVLKNAINVENGQLKIEL